MYNTYGTEYVDDTILIYNLHTYVMYKYVQAHTILITSWLD